MKKCVGENCNSTNGINHSKECRFEHFQSYSGFFNEPENVQEKIKTAYFHGYEAGEPDPVEPLFSSMGMSEPKFPSIK